MKNICILGSTGSIGTQTLEIVKAFPDDFEVIAISCHRDLAKLEDQIAQFRPKVVAVTDPSAFNGLENLKAKYSDVRFMKGKESLLELVSLPQVDTVVVSIVGNDALLPTIEAIQARKRVCIANKEVLVTSGHLIMPMVASLGVELLPVDSEHSALYQCLQGNSQESIEKVILTASGGPFRGQKREQLIHKTASEALKHPKWDMGKKISIDSATLMNKGLEVIEAKWLFSMKADQIDVVVHPQSIIHSMIQYKDRSIMAQMGLPDMRLPIIYALNYPKRMPSNLEPLDFAKLGTMTFEAPDLEAFPCLNLAYQAMEMQGLATTVLNAANEVLVDRYLKDEIKFYDIPKGIETALAKFSHFEQTDLEAVLYIDQETRQSMSQWKSDGTYYSMHK